MSHWDDHETVYVQDGEYILYVTDEEYYEVPADVEDGWYWSHKEDGPVAGPFESVDAAEEWAEKLYP